jgi:hypothetical protein
MKGHIGHMEEVVRKIFLDHVTFVAEADYKIVEAVMAVDFHDMPEDRTAPHLHHRLRTDAGFFAQPGAPASCQNNDLHDKFPGGKSRPAVQRLIQDSLQNREFCNFRAWRRVFKQRTAAPQRLFLESLTAAKLAVDRPEANLLA